MQDGVVVKVTLDTMPVACLEQEDTITPCFEIFHVPEGFTDHSWALHNTLQPTITYLPHHNIIAILNTCDRVSLTSVHCFLNTTTNFPFDALLTLGILTEIFSTLVHHNPTILAGQQQYLADVPMVLLSHPLLVLGAFKDINATSMTAVYPLYNPYKVDQLHPICKELKTIRITYPLIP